jgi:hypothetical protein
MRERLAYYPRDVWLYLLAAGWARIGQEEHLMGRAGTVGDEVGSALIGARLVRDIMRLAFIMERTYAPCAKWFAALHGLGRAGGGSGTRRSGECSPPPKNSDGCALLLEQEACNFGNARGLRHRISKPIGGPYSMYHPSETLEDGLAQAVPISGGLGTVVCRAIALDAKKITSRMIGVHDCEINRVAGNANLRIHGPSMCS